MPTGVEPVKDFELDRYLGKWYEIARLDHSFERGIQNVTAEYSMRDDGGVRVLNSDFKTAKGEWDQAEGKAYFVEEDDQGYRKVSFFGPFYGSYVVFKLDDNYEYAFISGPDTSYLWLMARQPEVSAELPERFKARAAELEFDMNELVIVEHPPRTASELKPAYGSKWPGIYALRNMATHEATYLSSMPLSMGSRLN
ncbi:MAG: lipocalin family protein [Gammaproteobacteria bacterium]|nr:lipocalin family protein [Gammaproteobacteria bacterium]MBT8050454.1 lipocalin family protein [Gammaproteobacteria bacterium]NNJ79616.1 lipocalin [Xanthomonadales bacterium]